MHKIFIYLSIYISNSVHCPMNGLCSLDNVVYQAIIYPKEDISDKKYYIRFFY